MYIYVCVFVCVCVCVLHAYGQQHQLKSAFVTKPICLATFSASSMRSRLQYEDTCIAV